MHECDCCVCVEHARDQLLGDVDGYARDKKTNGRFSWGHSAVVAAYLLCINRAGNGAISQTTCILALLHSISFTLDAAAVVDLVVAVDYDGELDRFLRTRIMRRAVKSIDSSPGLVFIVQRTVHVGNSKRRTVCVSRDDYLGGDEVILEEVKDERAVAVLTEKFNVHSEGEGAS